MAPYTSTLGAGMIRKPVAVSMLFLTVSTTLMISGGIALRNAGVVADENNLVDNFHPCLGLGRDASELVRAGPSRDSANCGRSNAALSKDEAHLVRQYAATKGSDAVRVRAMTST